MSTEFGTEWCPVCHASRDVVDRFTESRYEAAGEVEFQVVLLACGHDDTYGDRYVGPAPGGPSAGAGAVVAASPRAGDLWVAGVRQARAGDGDPTW